jgi:two-component system response regulator AtoC
MTTPCLMLVDDNAGFLELFRAMPECRDVELVTFTRVAEALAYLAEQPVDVIVSDVEMPEMDGNAFFNAVQDAHPDVPFIFLTAYGSTDKAIQAVKQGAFHYFEKPLHDRLDLFWATVRQALARRDHLREIAAWRRQEAGSGRPADRLIGPSAAMQRVRRAIAEVADLPVTVLVTGATGTGKELVARAVHARSGRRDRPFMPVNCAEFASGVLESELFGHERGAFTGAVEQRKGLFEITGHGTLFLDEICEAPVDMQAKLLRVLEDRRFRRVGGSVRLGAECRLVTATNRDLPAEVAAGRFRQDLFYRINVYTITIPPLRERREDIAPIAQAYLQRFNTQYQRSIEGFTEQALTALAAYDWPGNVRELVNVVERATITCRESRITSRHLPFAAPAEIRTSGLDLKAVEKVYIGLALERTGRNKSRAARLLNISRKTLNEKLKRYALDDNDTD